MTNTLKNPGGIQFWSKPDSELTAVPRPWTAIAVRTGNPRQSVVAYHDCATRTEAIEFFAGRIDARTWTTVAILNGHHDARILKVLREASRVLTPRES